MLLICGLVLVTVGAWHIHALDMRVGVSHGGHIRHHVYDTHPTRPSEVADQPHCNKVVLVENRTALQLHNHHCHAHVALSWECTEEFTRGPFPRRVVDHRKCRGTPLGEELSAVPNPTRVPNELARECVCLRG
jgi:hypothetical protein